MAARIESPIRVKNPSISEHFSARTPLGAESVHQCMKARIVAWLVQMSQFMHDDIADNAYGIIPLTNTETALICGLCLLFQVRRAMRAARCVFWYLRLAIRAQACWFWLWLGRCQTVDLFYQHENGKRDNQKIDDRVQKRTIGDNRQTCSAYFSQCGDWRPRKVDKQVGKVNPAYQQPKRRHQYVADK